MRTTLTLDDDVAEKLRSLAERRRATFKETVNDVLRRGLTMQQSPRKRTKFRVRTFSSALRSGIDPVRLNQLVDDLEVEHAGPRISTVGGS